MGDPKEAAPEAPVEDGPAPPPYNEFDVPAQAAPSYQALPSGGGGGAAIAGVSNRFPPALNAYFSSNAFSRNFHLGEHADQKLFAVTMHIGLSSKLLLELHAGPNHSDPVAATASNQNKWGSGKNSVVQIMPSALGPSAGPESALASASASGPSSAQSQATQTFTMNQQHDWKNVKYPFSADVGLAKDVRREDFEWRRSRGGEVQGLDKYAGYGFKLVRLGSAATGGGGERATRSEGATSDGKEVVAAWSYNSSWSVKKMFRFQFFESGATGVLGDQFALAALVTALRIWYVEFVLAARA
ncbi:hypothetical protein GGR54DRAFT_602887 [Hypoxylon sp. NC1633]|nr:hypothetical protein GGR54DRAFT_602887 [Hypoxylon sp. NC1633]